MRIRPSGRGASSFRTVVLLPATDAAESFSSAACPVTVVMCARRILLEEHGRHAV